MPASCLPLHAVRGNPLTATIAAYNNCIYICRVARRVDTAAQTIVLRVEEGRVELLTARRRVDARGLLSRLAKCVIEGCVVRGRGLSCNVLPSGDSTMLVCSVSRDAFTEAVVGPVKRVNVITASEDAMLNVVVESGVKEPMLCIDPPHSLVLEAPDVAMLVEHGLRAVLSLTGPAETIVSLLVSSLG